MATTFTFGALGDIISLCQLSIQLSTALSSSRGSSKQYQDLRKDLDQFISSLSEVIATFQGYEVSPILDTLNRVSTEIAEECGILVQETLDRVTNRYDASLSSGKSQGRLKDGLKKLEWAIRERDKATEELLSRIAEDHRLSVQTQIQDSSSGQSHALQLGIMNDHLVNQQESICPDPCRNEPVVLEDALGNILEINWGLIHHWEFFYKFLEHQFEGLRGYEMVVERSFMLEDGLSGAQISQEVPWKAAVREGMKINMIMVFKRNVWSTSYLCPACKTTCCDDRGSRSQCESRLCGLPVNISEVSGVRWRHEAIVEIGSLSRTVRGETQQITEHPKAFRRVRFLQGHHPLADPSKLPEYYSHLSQESFNRYFEQAANQAEGEIVCDEFF
ncbi:uncharacterized protein JN550_000291 [Neoarthrinium moseri]|uniref:uncharacterized protein n=1 Tax=Neoarthrinium moseri TaxID=1658444 RepID=UPI001FDC1C38|nr:uncharacterized protein JN550_000291 [Neoarthrinium moseri]KAI1878109.1 hypothetical protein JN550_000291 [Neoarthrinium moseri]